MGKPKQAKGDLVGPRVCGVLAEVRGQSALLVYPEDELSAHLLPVASAYAAVCVVSLNGSCLSNILHWEFDVDSKQVFQHIRSLTV